MRGEPIILESAHRHGVREKDVLHALRFAIRYFNQGDDMTLVVGPAVDGTLIEVGLVSWHEAIAVAHAMRPARSRFLEG